jgi:hypothetical protein
MHLCEFYPVAKRIAKFEALVAGYGYGVDDSYIVLLEMCAPGRDVVHSVGKMRSGGSTFYAVFSANMDLAIAYLEPEAASPTQCLRFLDFEQAEYATIEGPAFFFCAPGNRDLRMMQTKNACHPGKLSICCHQHSYGV